MIIIKVSLWNFYKGKTTGPKITKLVTGNGILYHEKDYFESHNQYGNGVVCCIHDQGFTDPVFMPIRNGL